MSDVLETNETAPAASNVRGGGKNEKSKQESAPTQFFVARFSIVTTNGTVAPGESVELTRKDYDVLASLGAIDGVWSD